MEFRYGDPVYEPTKAKPKEPDFLPVCLACGYDMRGNVSRRCPECGQAFVERDWERAVRDVKFKISEIEGYLQWVLWAWRIALVGILLRLFGLGLFFGGSLNTFIRGVTLVCGLAAVLIAVNVLRVRQLPVWARGHLKIKADPLGAALGVGCGLAAVASAVLLK